MPKKFIILLISLFFLFSCSEQIRKDPDILQKKSTTLPASVDIDILQYSDFSEELVVNGKIESAQLIDVFIANPGVINKLPIFNGTLVDRDDTLVVIENSEKKIQLAKANIALEEAENELNSLMLGYGGSVNDTNSVSKDILKSLNIRSGYSRAIQDLKIARLNYDRTFFKAPFSAIVADLKYQKNQYYSSNEPLCKLIDHRSYLVSFYITENELDNIYINQSLRINTISNEDEFLYGTITEINPIVDEHSLIQVVGQINTVSESIMNGMNAKIIIEKRWPHSLTIPKKALVLRNNKKVVFTFKSGLAYWNYVETSAENSSSYIISEGLSAGDTVIVDGNLNLAHEAEVIITK